LDTSEVKGPLSPAAVRAFLQREAFYVGVVLLVAAMSALGTAAAFRGQDSAAPAGAPPIDQDDLRASYDRALQDLREQDPHAAAFPLFVSHLNQAMLLAGSVVLMALCAGLAVRGRGLLRGGRPLAPPWGLWDALKLGAFFTLGAMVFRGIFPTNPANPFSMPGDWLAELFARTLLVGVMVHIVVAERGGGLGDLGLRWKGAASAVGLGLAGFLAVQPLLHLVEMAQRRWISLLPLQAPLQGILTARTSATLPLAAFVAVIVAPVTEEMFFRGFVQPALQRWVGRVPGVLAGAAFFAAAHVDLYNLAPLFLLGMVLGFLYDRTRSLVAPVTLHVAHNGAAMLTILAYRQVFGASGM